MPAISAEPKQLARHIQDAIAADGRVILSGVSWSSFESVLHALEREGRRLRATYAAGDLEFMSTTASHAWMQKIVARLLETLTEELDVAIRGLGSTTLLREDLECGVEPDECWYIEHEALIRTRLRTQRVIDFTVDPPPDLAVEIEVSRTVLSRIDVYKSLRVPELWRYDGTNLRFPVLNEAGDYEESAHSRSFPALAAADLTPFLNRVGEDGETQIVKEFRQWVRFSRWKRTAHNKSAGFSRASRPAFRRAERLKGSREAPLKRACGSSVRSAPPAEAGGKRVPAEAGKRVKKSFTALPCRTVSNHQTRRPR